MRDGENRMNMDFNPFATWKELPKRVVTRVGGVESRLGQAAHSHRPGVGLAGARARID